MEETSVSVASPVSISVTVGVPVAVDVLASSVTPPVLAFVAIEAASFTLLTVITNDCVF